MAMQPYCRINTYRGAATVSGSLGQHIHSGPCFLGGGGGDYPSVEIAFAV